jgi:hypothetical protein
MPHLLILNLKQVYPTKVTVYVILVTLNLNYSNMSMTKRTFKNNSDITNALSPNNSFTILKTSIYSTCKRFQLG